MRDCNIISEINCHLCFITNRFDTLNFITYLQLETLDKSRITKNVPKYLYKFVVVAKYIQGIKFQNFK